VNPLGVTVVKTNGWFGSGALALTLALASGWAVAVEALHLRVVGGLGGVRQYTHQEAPFWMRELPRLSQGRVTAEIAPFDQAGMRGEEMLRLLKSGSVSFGTLLLARTTSVEPELGVVDLPGMNPDFATLRRHLAAYRQHLEAVLRERHDIEPLAIYVYPSQVTFCSKPFRGLGDLAGRRVRVVSPAHGDLLRALGAQPVQTEFGQIVPALRAGTVDCAITGSMSGHTIGLDEVTTHIDPKALSWGLSVFGANQAAWRALPEDVQQLLRRGLADLERAVWADAERESGEGVACLTGAAGCTQPRRARMTLVSAGAADTRRLREALERTVLPGWVQRCGAACAMAWNRHLAPAVGLRASAP
jgi:TRAP-type C4-dicarboxylate transport system substrate-binding protein